jgi:competence protein ComFC
MIMAGRMRIDKLRTIETRIRPLYSSLVDLFFPPQCVYCRTIGNRICDSCAAGIPWIGSACCEACGLPGGDRCEHICIERGQLQFIRSAAVFSGPMRKALHALKYDSDRSLAALLVRLAHPHWALPAWSYDVLIPVPLGKKRERARGYNQSLLLAEALSRMVGVPVAAGSITRVRETPTQVGLSYPERKRNVADAFQATAVAGKRILLVDDVCTTGATLQSCAEALGRAGALGVGALTLARAAPPAAR